MRPQGWRETVLGNEPPLANAARLPDRRAISLRWMAGLVLMGGAAAALLVGALVAALGSNVRFAIPPIAAGPRFLHQTVAEASRGDRDQRRVAGAAVGRSAVRIEQLNDSGNVRPFTRVSAQLAQIDPEPRLEQDQAPRATADRADNGSPPASELPSIIRFGTSRPPLPRNVTAYAEDQPQRSNARIIGQPLNVTFVAKSPPSHEIRQHVVVARAGDTLSSILSALGASTGDVGALLASFPRRHWFDKEAFTGGEIVTIMQDTSGPNTSPAHILKVKVEKPGIGIAAVARTDAGRYKPVVAEQAEAVAHNDALTSDGPDLRLSSAESLRVGLYALAQSNHVDEGVVAELMRLCAHDFDLDQPLGATDAADFLYAPDDLGQPELMFVELTAQEKNKRYYRFTASDDGSTDFYDGNGRSITEFLLRKPVVDGRLGDGFGWRVHPILHDRRFHEGVDYAAPYGSPVAAAGAGVVEIIGREWGYGKYIRIRHDLGYETTYAHVAGFPDGRKVGDRVRQGETIAYVGSTGLSTGPHLYYEVWINGHRVNPLKIRLASGRMLQGNILKQFGQSTRQIDELIDASSDVTASR